MQPEAGADAQARVLIRAVYEDTELDLRVRRAAQRLNTVRASNPQIALDRLNRLHRAAVGCLATQPPTVEYCRLVGLETFWNHNLEGAIKEVFATPASYARYVSSASDPAETLSLHVGSQEVADAAHSWMVPYSHLQGLTSIQARARLRFHQDPPFVVMVFSVKKMIANNVMIRDPRGLDVIPSRILDWFPGNVPDEKINSDIPRAALARIEWLP